MIPIFESAARRFRQHPGDKDLVLYLERELPSRDIAAVEQHIAQCWSCRQRLNQLQQGIHTYVEFRRRRMETGTAGGCASADRFLLRLAAEERRSPECAGLWSWFRPAWALPTLLAVLATGWLVWRSTEAPVVSAHALLRQSALLETGRGGASATRPGLRLRVARRVDGQWATALMYADDGRVAAGERSVLDDLLVWLGRAGLPGHPSLSALQFEDWAQRLGARLEAEPVGLDEGLHWRITAEPPDRTQPVWIHIALLLRDRDKLAVEQKIVFRQLDSAVEYTLTREAASTPRRAQTRLAAPPLPTPVPLPAVSSGAEVLDLARALTELDAEAHYALHRAGLSLSGNIRIVREAAGLALEGVVETPEERARLMQLLPDRQSIEIRLVTVSETRSPGLPARVDVHLPDGERSVQVENERWLSERLAPALPEEEQFRIVAAFGRDALAHSQSVLQHAWAFRRLREHYLPSRIELLPQSHRLLIHEIAVDHLLGMEEGLRSLSQALHPLLPELPAGARQAAVFHSIIELPERIDRLCRILFAGLPGNGWTTNEILEQLALALAQGPSDLAVHRAAFAGLIEAPAASTSSSLSTSTERLKP
jgi:hypothetical protein